MKVSDVMQRSVIKVAPSDPIKDVARLIFSLGISGVPVVEKKKLVGIVTEEDIFKKIHPTISDISEDYIHSKSFESMEEEVKNILETPVKKIMNEKVHTISQDVPIMKAQTLMLLYHFSRLPVINDRNELVGIISQGDIFREVIKNEIPQIEKERFASFIAKNYDSSVKWDERLSIEFPLLFGEFKKHNVESIIGLGSWTGQYVVELVNKGVKKMLALDPNPSMIEISKSKQKRMNPDRARRLKFKLSDFMHIDREINEKFDAMLATGNSLAYIPVHINSAFSQVAKVLRKKHAVIMFQLLNFDKILESGRLLSFSIASGKGPYEKEHLYIEFFDRNEHEGKLMQRVVIFDSDGKNWIFKGITSVPVFHYTKSDIEKALRSAGFNKISITGNEGKYGIISSKEPFNPRLSDWINVIAIRE
jgi:CBS domain-containing protein/SAM-dependent methyltransferase